MKRLITAFIICLISSNIYAAEVIDKELAIEYLKLSKTDEIINASIQQYETQLFANVKPEDKATLRKMMEDSMGWDAVKDQLVDVVINVYTKEEIVAYIEFMKSPLGASATAKRGEF
jgi:hypothetical protein